MNLKQVVSQRRRHRHLALHCMIFISNESREVGPPDSFEHPGLGLLLTDVPAKLETSTIKGRGFETAAGVWRFERFCFLCSDELKSENNKHNLYSLKRIAWILQNAPYAEAFCRKGIYVLSRPMFSLSSMIHCQSLAHWGRRAEHCVVPWVKNNCDSRRKPGGRWQISQL